MISLLKFWFSKESRPNAGWGDWLDSPEGKEFEKFSGRVYDFLEAGNHRIDGEKRKIVARGRSLTIDQVVSNASRELGSTPSVVAEHVLMWMCSAGDAADPEFEGTQEHVDIVHAWVDEECEKRDITLRM